MTALERAKKRWGQVNTHEFGMIVDDVPFQFNPNELIPVAEHMDELRDGFDTWMESQGELAG